MTISETCLRPTLLVRNCHSSQRPKLALSAFDQRLLFQTTVRKPVRILLYNPDNGVTRNFMPHLWMFLLQALTPPGHEVLLMDGNAQPMDEAGLARFVREQNIGLVGIGAMTRMIAKAYRMADAIRATGVPVVMGGPHVTELSDEALGRDGGPRHADAVALGEADETWPRDRRGCRARRAPGSLRSHG